MDSLDLKYAFSVLREIYSNSGTVNKKELSKVVKSHQVLDNLLDSLQKDGYIEISSNKIGPRVYSISLTPKGKAVSKTFNTIGNEENGNEEQVISLSKSDYLEYTKNFKNISVLSHLNVLDDHIALRELNYDHKGNDRVVFVYVKLNGNGIMRLWCEVDNSFTCWHVKYAWTLPDVQAMVQYQIKHGNARGTD